MLYSDFWPWTTLSPLCDSLAFCEVAAVSAAAKRAAPRRGVGADTLFWDDKHIRQPVYARINARLLLQPRFHDIDHVTTVAYAPCTNTSLLMHHMWSQDKWDAIDEEGLLAC